MSEEIKETLDWTLEYLEGIDKTRGTKILTTNEANILLDYITNLQQKVEQLEKENEHLRTQVNAYENPNDLTLFYMWLDEKAKDKIKQLENIRKEAIEYIYKHIQEYDVDGTFTNLDEFDFIASPQTLLNILNKGDNNGK